MLLSAVRTGGGCALHARSLVRSLTKPAVAPFQFTEVFPTDGPHEFPYRKLTGDYVSTVDGPGGVPILKVEPEALTLLAAQAMTDIAHLLRPGHLQQLANILKVRVGLISPKPPLSPPGLALNQTIHYHCIAPALLSMWETSRSETR